MQEAAAETTIAGIRPFGPIGRALLVLTKNVAIAGGLVFVALVAMSLVSIVGRKLFAWTVPGDVELLQMCSAFAASTFFAYCHLAQGDVKVDFFTHRMPFRTVAAMDAFASLLVALFGGLIAWRTAALALANLRAGTTSGILELPEWIPQALMVPSFALLCLAGTYMCVHQVLIARGTARAGSTT